MTIKGTKGNDNLKGTSGNDIFDLSQGGNDTVNGEGGNDKFIFKGAFTAKDSVNGGSGNDTLSLAGNYAGSHKVSFGAKTIVSVETIVLGKGHDYSLTTSDANVGKNKTLTVDAHALGAGDVLTFNGSHETNGKFDIIGGKGNDHLTGGAKNDTFDLTHGGNDTANGGGGNDSFNMGAALTAADRINGGTGSDTLTLNGAYDLTFGATTFRNIAELVLTGAHNYTLVTNDANVASGFMMNLDASGIDSSHHLVFDQRAETDGSICITGGQGDDTILIGSSEVWTGGGPETVNGGAGNDTVILDGDYSAGLTFASNSLTSVETLKVDAGHSYNFTFADGNVASGATMTLDASALGAGNSLTVNAATESDGHFDFTGGAGADTIVLGSPDVLNGSSVDGGAGNDTLELAGDFHNGFTLNQLASIEKIVLASGFNYSLSIAQAHMSDTGSMVVDGSQLDASHQMSFDFSGVTSGAFTVTGGAASDTIAVGGPDVLAASELDGGGAGNTLYITGNYSAGFTLTGTEISNIAQINLGDDGAHNYDLTAADSLVGSGDTLTINWTSFASNRSVTFDGSAETNGRYVFNTGDGNDYITGGDKSDHFILTAGGNDTVGYSAAAQSTGTNFDQVQDFSAAHDLFDLDVAVSNVNSVSGSIDASTFDTDIANAVSGHMAGAHDAVVITASGDYTGQTFLVIDLNGDHAYTDGSDLVIELTGVVPTLTTANFTNA